jgi:hypothetical protein
MSKVLLFSRVDTCKCKGNKPGAAVSELPVQSCDESADDAMPPMLRAEKARGGAS